MTVTLTPRSELLSSGCFPAALTTGQLQPMTAWTSFVLPRHALSIHDLLRLCQLTPTLALCLDYDGTLVPIASRSEDARPSPTLLTLLSQLAQLPSVDVAVFSGRPLDELRTLLPVPGLVYVSTHGLEIRTVTGETKRLLPEGAFTTIFKRFRSDITALVSGRPGCAVKDKRQVLALHYRLAHPEDGEWAIAQVLALVATYQSKGVALEILHGKKVVEVRPRGVNKRKALQSVMNLGEKTTLSLDIGDDETDEDAFRVLNRRGITIEDGFSP